MNEIATLQSIRGSKSAEVEALRARTSTIEGEIASLDFAIKALTPKPLPPTKPWVQALIDALVRHMGSGKIRTNEAIFALRDAGLRAPKGGVISDLHAREALERGYATGVFTKEWQSRRTVYYSVPQDTDETM